MLTSIPFTTANCLFQPTSHPTSPISSTNSIHTPTTTVYPVTDVPLKTQLPIAGPVPFRSSSSCLEFVSHSTVVPHPAKREKGGEDAHFFTPRCLGIADGVSGWGDMGIDPAIYAQTFMKECESYVSKLSKEDHNTFDPIDMIKHVDSKCKTIVGSSTVLTVFLRNDNQVVVRNIGDSRCMVLRLNTDGVYECIFITEEHQKKFNHPFQLGTRGDDPNVAVGYCVEVQENDLIILGTDGLFDNMYISEIVNIVNQSFNQIEINDLKIVADKIAQVAFEHSLSRGVLSPYALLARGNGFPNALGGKSDDITVLVTKVRRV